MVRIRAFVPCSSVTVTAGPKFTEQILLRNSPPPQSTLLPPQPGYSLHGALPCVVGCARVAEVAWGRLVNGEGRRKASKIRWSPSALPPSLHTFNSQPPETRVAMQPLPSEEACSGPPRCCTSLAAAVSSGLLQTSCFPAVTVIFRVTAHRREGPHIKYRDVFGIKECAQARWCSLISPLTPQSPRQDKTPPTTAPSPASPLKASSYSYPIFSSPTSPTNLTLTITTTPSPIHPSPTTHPFTTRYPPTPFDHEHPAAPSLLCVVPLVHTS